MRTASAMPTARNTGSVPERKPRREQLHAPLARIHRHLAERLRGVAMQRYARRQLITQLRDFEDGEDPARLVLHTHHRDKRGGAILQLFAQLLHVKAAIRRIDVTAIPIMIATHAADGSGNRRMLQRGGDDLARVLTLSQARPTYCQVVRLR